MNFLYDDTVHALQTAASQPINEGGQSPGAPRSKGPPSATCKNLCHEIITDTLLTSDTLTISASYALHAVEVDLSSATRLLSMALGELRCIRASWESTIAHGFSYSNSLEDPNHNLLLSERGAQRDCLMN